MRYHDVTVEKLTLRLPEITVEIIGDDGEQTGETIVYAPLHLQSKENVRVGLIQYGVAKYQPINRKE